VRAGEAARALGISAATLRRLDRKGLVDIPRDLRGHRRLTPGNLEALRVAIYPRREVSPDRAGIDRTGVRRTQSDTVPDTGLRAAGKKARGAIEEVLDLLGWGEERALSLALDRLLQIEEGSTNESRGTASAP
jgi:hypothetical protein